MASSEVPMDMMSKMNSLENHHQVAAGRADYLARPSVAEMNYSASMMPTIPSPLYISNSSTHNHGQQPYVNVPEEYRHYNKHNDASSSVAAMATAGTDSHHLDNLDRSLKSLIGEQADQSSSSGSDTDEDGSSHTQPSKQFDPIRNLMPMRQHTKWTLQQQKRNTELMNSQQVVAESNRSVHQEVSESVPETNRLVPESSRPTSVEPDRPLQHGSGSQVGVATENAYSRPYGREAGVTDNQIEELVKEYFAGRNPMTADQEQRMEEDEDDEGSQQGAALSDAENESNVREEDLDEEDLEGGEVEDTDGSGQSHACEDCLQVFRSKALLIYHQRKNWHGGLEPYLCPECGQEFGAKSHLRSHVATHSSIKPFQCPVKGCERTFARVDQVNNHLQLRHRTLSKVRRKDYYQGIPLVEAAEVSENGEKLNDRQPGAAATDIACEDCGKTFKNRTLFYYHQHKNGHGGKMPYVCTVCSATFGVRTHLKLHMRKHTKERPYQCPMPHCGRFFSRIDAVNIHLKNVHNNAAKVGAKDYRNVPMNNMFPVLPPMMPLPQMNQERQLTEDRGFSCSDCDAAYKTKALLDYHQRKLGHGGMKPFSCPICGAGFGHRSHLRGHLRKHTRARPFFCPVPGCPKRFSRVDIVNVHLKRVHKETLKVTMKDYMGLDLDGPHGKVIMSNTRTGVHHLSPKKMDEPVVPRLSPGDHPNPTDNPAASGEGRDVNAADVFNPAMNLLLPSALNNVSLQLPATAMLSSLGMRPGMAASTQANYMCNLCQKPFTDLISLQAHMRQHGTPKLYLCPVPGCGKYLSRVGIVNNHLQTIHGLNIRVSAWDYKSQRIPMFDPTKQMNPNNPGNMLSPPITGGMDKNNMDLSFTNSASNHPDHSNLNMMNKHANLMSLSLERFSILGGNFHRKFASAGAHMDNVTIMRKRRAKMSFKTKSVWCRCQQCNYQTSTKTMMILHQRHHKGLDRYQCKHCSAHFRLKSIYYRHVIKCAGTAEAESLSTRRSSEQANVTADNPFSPKLTPFAPLQHMRSEVSSKYFQVGNQAEHQSDTQITPSLTHNHQSVICSRPNTVSSRNNLTDQPAHGTSGHSDDRHSALLDQTRLPASTATTSDLTSTYLKMLQFDTSKNSSKLNTTQGSHANQGLMDAPQNAYNTHNAAFPTAGAFLSGLQGQSGLLSSITNPGNQPNSGTLGGAPDFSLHDQMQKQQGAQTPLPNIEAVAKYIKDRLPTASMYASVAQTILSCTQTYANNTTLTHSSSQSNDTHVTYANRSTADSPVRNTGSDMLYPHASGQANMPYGDSHGERRTGDSVNSSQIASNSSTSAISNPPASSSATFTGIKDAQQPPYLSTDDKSPPQNDTFPSPNLPSFSQIKSEPLPSSSAMGWGLPGLGVGGMGVAASMYQNLMYPMLAAAAWGNTPYSQPGGGMENMSDRNSVFAAQGSSPQDCAYKCDDCGEAFRTKPLLVYHQRKNNHGGLHGFTCQDCGATFGTRCHLESHSRKHTKERPFKCPLCSSAYSRVDIVNVHLKTVHRSPLKVRASDYSRSRLQGDI